MNFIKSPPQAAINDVVNRLTTELVAGKQVVWLVSGGSNVMLEVAIMDSLRDQISENLQNLTIIPMDERYGDPGHENSNTEFMRRSGFLPGAAEWIDVLAHDVSFNETIAYYEDVISEAFAVSHIIVGQFGLGSDGHVAGILPGSPACEEDYANVVGYEWNDYVRLTLSPRALRAITVAFVPAYGSDKELALKRMQQNAESIEDLPASLLYNIPEVCVYNEQIESEA